MKHRILHATGVVLLVVALSACRQSDGAVPQPTGERVNKVEDVSRDLLALSRGDAPALPDLHNDVLGLSPEEAPRSLVEDLVSGLQAALHGRSLSANTAEELANMLFVTVMANELSERQIAALKQDVTDVLTGVGASEPAAQHVAAAVGEIQAAIGTNVRRWWHTR